MGGSVSRVYPCRSDRSAFMFPSQQRDVLDPGKESSNLHGICARARIRLGWLVPVNGLRTTTSRAFTGLHLVDSCRSMDGFVFNHARAGSPFVRRSRSRRFFGVARAIVALFSLRGRSCVSLCVRDVPPRGGAGCAVIVSAGVVIAVPHR